MPVLFMPLCFPGIRKTCKLLYCSFEDLFFRLSKLPGGLKQ